MLTKFLKLEWYHLKQENQSFVYNNTRNIKQ